MWLKTSNAFEASLFVSAPGRLHSVVRQVSVPWKVTPCHWTYVLLDTKTDFHIKKSLLRGNRK